VCDYEGSGYSQEFWQNQGRDYEDRVERIALRRLLPPRGGRRILEIGAGFGRLTNELAGFEQVVLLDYSRSMWPRRAPAWGTNAIPTWRRTSTGCPSGRAASTRRP
jgi:SAM-dependent methyltransferase